MLSSLLRAGANLLSGFAFWAQHREDRDTRTDAQIRANPRAGDWWDCGCGFRTPILADLRHHECCPTITGDGGVATVRITVEEYPATGVWHTRINYHRDDDFYRGLFCRGSRDRSESIRIAIRHARAMRRVVHND